MQARRLAKRSSMGSRRLSAGPAAAQTDGARPPKPESAWRPPRREGSAAAVEEEDEDEDVVVEVEEEEEEEEGGLGSPPPALSAHGKGPLRASLKVRPGGREAAGGPGRSARSPLPAGGREAAAAAGRAGPVPRGGLRRERPLRPRPALNKSRTKRRRCAGTRSGAGRATGCERPREGARREGGGGGG